MHASKKLPGSSLVARLGLALTPAADGWTSDARLMDCAADIRRTSIGRPSPDHQTSIGRLSDIQWTLFVGRPSEVRQTSGRRPSDGRNMSNERNDVHRLATRGWLFNTYRKMNNEEPKRTNETKTRTINRIWPRLFGVAGKTKERAKRN